VGAIIAREKTKWKMIDDGLTFTDSGYVRTSLQKEIGFFDYAYEDNRGKLYCREIMFSKGIQPE
jgi:hypothetical protein